MVLELDVKRDEYKALLKEAEANGDKVAARKWNAMQLSVKRMRASFYGIMAFEKFSWHDADIAKTITMGGRNALLSIKKKAEEEGFRVVFGHTDSIFVTMPKEWTKEQVLEESNKLARLLTDHVQAEVRSKAVVVELEAIMDRYFIAKKNRYAGRKVWDDKKGFLDIDFTDHGWPEVTRKMSGMEAKQTNTARVGRTIQIETLARIFNDEEPVLIQQDIEDLVRDIRNGEVDDSLLHANAKVGKWVPHHVDWRWTEKSCECGMCPEPKTGEGGRTRTPATQGSSGSLPAPCSTTLFWPTTPQVGVRWTRVTPSAGPTLRTDQRLSLRVAGLGSTTPSRLLTTPSTTTCSPRSTSSTRWRTSTTG